MTTAVAESPTVRERIRGGRAWIVLGVIALLVAIVGLVVSRGGSAGTPLDADSPAPAGSKAVVQVLREHGVQVTVTGSVGQAQRALERGPSTLLLYDPNGYLGDDALSRLDDAASATVLVRPGFAALRAFAPDVRHAGFVDSRTRSAQCSLAVAERAGRITGGGNAYRSEAGTGCFPTGSGAYQLVQDARVSVIGTSEIFDNEHTVRSGNAALALGLLGTQERLVWYLPTATDAAGSDLPTLGELTPGWVTPSIVLLIAAGLAAAIWRGRRFGPLVVENLPVVVRSEEAMEGRARLYERGNARLRALDALRIAAVGRIASRLGLPRSADAVSVADAAAAALHADPRRVRATLVDAVPASDAELMRLSAEVTELEHAVTRGSFGDGIRTNNTDRPLDRTDPDEGASE
jgi:hypothetical protein